MKHGALALVAALSALGMLVACTQEQPQSPPPGYYQQPPQQGYQAPPPGYTAAPPPGYATAQPAAPAYTAPPQAPQPEYTAQPVPAEPAPAATAPAPTAAPAGSGTPTAIPGVTKNPDGTCSITPPSFNGQPSKPLTGPCPPGI
jgi:hypothetical protein